MTKTKPKPFTLMPPTEPAPPAKPEQKPFMSSDVRIEHDDTKPTPPRRGPQVAEGSMGAADFIQAFATREELERWRREIEERRARDLTTWIWQKCDRPACGLVLKARPDEGDGQICPRCNLAKRCDLGHLHTMTEEATNAYLFEQAKKERAAVERDRQRAFHATNAERGTKGLAPLTLEEFRKRANAEYLEMRQRQRELGKIAAPYREKATK
jgi:hypothetical protein